MSRCKFRKMYLTSGESVRVVHKVAFLVRELGSNYFGSSQFLPLFPNVLMRSLDLVSNEYCLKILEAFISQENLTKIDSSDVKAKFQRIVSNY